MAQCACGVVIYYLGVCCVQVVILTGYDCADACCIVCVLRVCASVGVQAT